MRLLVILLVCCYGFGNLLLPSGNVAYTLNLSDMYRQCSTEDYDITPADFFFEHLLNLEDLLAHFEHETEQDKPHQPVFSVNGIPFIAITSAQPSPVYESNEPVIFITEKFPLHSQSIIPQHTLSDIFRPPITRINL